MSTLVLSATVESWWIATTISLPSGEIATSPSPLVVIERREIRPLACCEIDAEQMLPLARPEFIPMAPHQSGPDSRVGRIAPVALIDLLGDRPLDIARHDESRPVRQPHRIGRAIGQVRHFARVATGGRHRPHLRARVARRDERERLAVWRPARLPVRPRTVRELARLAGGHAREPDA